MRVRETATRIGCLPFMKILFLDFSIVIEHHSKHSLLKTIISNILKGCLNIHNNAESIILTHANLNCKWIMIFWWWFSWIGICRNSYINANVILQMKSINSSVTFRCLVFKDWFIQQHAIKFLVRPSEALKYDVVGVIHIMIEQLS